MDKLLEKIGWSQAYFAKRIGAPEYALAYLRQIAKLVGE